MKTLLGYIGKERHADSLVEKLMLRFEAAHKPEQWKNLAFCLTQVCHTLIGQIIPFILHRQERASPHKQSQCLQLHGVAQDCLGVLGSASMSW